MLLMFFSIDMPMKAMPVLTVKTGDEEKVYCQSSAIAKFFARENGKGPDLFRAKPVEFSIPIFDLFVLNETVTYNCANWAGYFTAGT